MYMGWSNYYLLIAEDDKKTIINEEGQLHMKKGNCSLCKATSI